MKEDFTEAPRPLSKWNDLQNGIETKERAVSRPSQLALEYLRWKWNRNYQRKYSCQRELTMNGQLTVVQHYNLLISSCSALMEPRVIINVRPDPPLYMIIRMRTKRVGASCEVEDSFLVTIFPPARTSTLFHLAVRKVQSLVLDDTSDEKRSFFPGNCFEFTAFSIVSGKLLLPTVRYRYNGNGLTGHGIHGEGRMGSHKGIR